MCKSKHQLCLPYSQYQYILYLISSWEAFDWECYSCRCFLMIKDKISYVDIDIDGFEEIIYDFYS